MARDTKERGCTEYDAIHGSRKKNHICSCSITVSGHKSHLCPTCGRAWGHPEYPYGIQRKRARKPKK